MDKEKEKGKKNFFKKPLTWLTCGVIALSSLSFVGCDNGTSPKDGEDGTKWYYGVENPTANIGKVGDFYFETDVCNIWAYDANEGWIIISNIKGDKGENGNSVYVGYDGYIWNGAERTEFKLENTTQTEEYAENTITLYNNKYFTTGDLSLEKPIALMGNYFPTIKKTGYSGTTISEISIYADKTGQIEIGTAKVADVVNSRNSGDKLITKTTTYDVFSGVNKIELNLKIGEDETLVIGGDKTTVNTYMSQGVVADDEYGLFTVCDEMQHDDILHVTNQVEDKLIIQVKATYKTEKAVFEDYRDLADASFKQYGVTCSDASASPMTFSNLSYFENKTISRIDVPIHYIKTKDQPSITLYVVDVSSGNFKDNTMSKVVEEINLVVPESYIPEDLQLTDIDTGVQGYVINTWVSFDNLNIQLKENQTLALCNPNGLDNAVGGFITNKGSSFGQAGEYATISSSIGDVTQYGQIGMDVYEMIDSEFSYNVERLKEEENYAKEHIREIELKEILAGKKVSILGDSISTYANYSNNADYNESLPDNNVAFYTNQISVDDTWWKRVIDNFDMELCVNNSQGAMGMLAASNSLKGYERAELLDNVSGENPDIIFVFLGANDSSNTVGSVDAINWNTLIVNEGDHYTYATPTTFAEAYAIAIHKMQQKYPNADIILMEQIPQIEANGGVAEAMTKNNVIKQLGEYFGLTTVDFIANGYVADSTNVIDNIHPNAKGMAKIEEILFESLYQMYVVK